MGAERSATTADRDVVVRALSSAMSRHQRVKVERADADPCQPGAESPDVILRDATSHRVLRVCAIETRLAAILRRAERWRRLARLGPLTVIVPKGTAPDAERLLRYTEARVVEYELEGDDSVVFSPAL